MNQGFEKFQKLSRCLICSSRQLHAYKRATFDFERLSKEHVKITDSEYGKIWNLDECEECGHIFANPAPAPEFIFTLYSQIEDPAYDEEAEGRSKNFLKILTKLEKLLPAKGTLFDVGAATGVLLNCARQRGWETDGIEASRWAIKFAEKKYHLPLQQGFFEETELKPDAYQALTMVDFLEHTPKPREALAKAQAILKKGGILCLVTPDVHSLAAKVAGKKWWHFRPAHLSYFSWKSLSRLLYSSGFKPIKKRRYSWTFSANYLFSRKKFFHFLSLSPSITSFLKRIPIKLALGDSFEIYATKD